MTPLSHPDAPVVFARPTASSTWTMAHVGSLGASGTAIVGQVTEVQAQLGYTPELPHSPDLSPVDVFSGTFLAATTAAIYVCKYRDTFRVSQTVDDPGDLLSG